jgi:carbamate kinase
MGPKVRAAIDFLDAGGTRAIITSAPLLVQAVKERNVGTQVVVPARTHRSREDALVGPAT